MINISISPSLKKANPNLTLAIIHASVKVEKHSSILWDEINNTIANISKQYSLEGLTNLPEVEGVRNTYKQLGKEPSRYRGSAEALLRRILQGKGLYKINNIVDLNNLVSIKTRHPVGSYDLNNISQPIIFTIGGNGEYYKGIGKENINITGLPVFVDKTGPYGSPTSDSERAMITANTKEILMIIISFTGKEGLDNALNDTVNMLEKFASAEIIEKFIIKEEV